MNKIKGNPQLEDGYTRIANELLDAIIEYSFSCGELKIILFIIRKTYGWQKNKSPISNGLIAKRLKMDVRYIKRRINKLKLDNVIFKDKTCWKNILGLNKNYTSWRLWKTRDSQIL